MTETGKYLIGVDVGTGSARAGVFDLAGRMIGSAKRDITIWREPGAIVEQSGNQIWDAVCGSVKSAIAEAAIAPSDVIGMGFDATCSLVVVGPDGAPLAVGPSGDPERNVIVWMDHRAIGQAERINAEGHDVLRYVGGVISPEMETPKLLWLAENRPETFAAAGHFFDLADYLSWRATGSLARSTCTVTCKWTYLAHEARWDESYFRQIGLGALADEGFRRIGTEIVAPGTKIAELNAEAATDLGLVPGIAVASGLIDAHAGGVGTVGVDGAPVDSLAYVFGTSSCTMTTTADPVFVPGVWGPYYQAMVPQMWLNEGGQSAAGAAIDQLLSFHPAVAEAAAQAREDEKPLPVWLADRALQTAGSASDAVMLGHELTVVPEFLGNRAPFADPHARAVIAGLGMERDIDSLVALYVAGIASIGYGLRQIVETQSENGANVRQIVISGGAGAHDLTRQILADATGLPLIATEAEEPVLLGSAILGAVAAGAYPDMAAAMKAMTRAERTYAPADGAISAEHQRKYEGFRAFQYLARQLRNPQIT